MGKVSIVKTHSGIKKALYKSIDLIGGIAAFIHKNDTVLVKPNLNDFESFTSPELVESLIELLFDHGIKNVFIAESTFGNEFITEKHFEKSGYYGIAKKFNIELINLNKSPVVEKTVKNPLILGKIRVAKDLERATKIINIPVMKVHYATGVSLCLKNLKGFLAKDEKKHFHEAGLDGAIVDLNNEIKTDLNIIDCTSCMEKMGPKGGDVFNLHLLIAGKNIEEVDSVGAEVMGYRIDEVVHLKKYIEVNHLTAGGIDIVGEKLASVLRPFKRVDLRHSIPKTVVIHDKNACSACVNALLVSFRFLENQSMEHFEIFMGNCDQGAPKGGYIAFGNCCDMKGCDIEVKGCPPYPLVLNEKIKEYKEQTP
jgi:uncharacterized protein (DUF362 family)